MARLYVCLKVIFYVNLRKLGIKSNHLGYVRLNGSCIYHKNGNPIYLKEVIEKLKRHNHLIFILIQACHLTFPLIQHALWLEA